MKKVGTEEGVEYDKTEHTVTVTVVADGQGLLTATVSYADGKAVVFTNNTRPCCRTVAPSATLVKQHQISQHGSGNTVN